MATPIEASTPRIVTPGARSGRATASIISVERAEVFGFIRRMQVIVLFMLFENGHAVRPPVVLTVR
jgi:hypothetical protein